MKLTKKALNELKKFSLTESKRIWNEEKKMKTPERILESLILCKNFSNVYTNEFEGVLEIDTVRWNNGTYSNKELKFNYNALEFFKI